MKYKADVTIKKLDYNGTPIITTTKTYHNVEFNTVDNLLKSLDITLDNAIFLNIETVRSI